MTVKEFCDLYLLADEVIEIMDNSSGDQLYFGTVGRLRRGAYDAAHDSLEGVYSVKVTQNEQKKYDVEYDTALILITDKS